MSDDFDLDDGYTREKPAKNYPKCYVDAKHDGDPICKSCAKELYGAIPKRKFKYPRNCWNCEELGITTVDETYEEPYYE